MVMWVFFDVFNYSLCMKCVWFDVKYLCVCILVLKFIRIWLFYYDYIVNGFKSMSVKDMEICVMFSDGILSKIFLYKV